MAPTKKVRSVNKRYANKDSPVKDVVSSGKSNQKRKLSDKLGPQWSKGELQCFYEAYRNYGQEWKNVAAQVHNRSAEMVESFYSMNRAYLSLPEGTASVVGLIAMMTDHYHVLEGSDSERERNDASGMPRKIQKHEQAKFQLGVSKEDLTGTWSMAATGGCLLLLKSASTNGSQPRAVKQRTPRYPVSYSHNKDDFIPLNKKGGRSDADANDDEVVHVAALALTEASQRGGSPQISHCPYEITEHENSLPVHSWDKMLPKAEIASLNVRNDASKEGSAEVTILKRRPENGTYSRGSKSLMDMEGVGTVEVHRKGKRFYRKKMKVKETRSIPSDNEGEACSGTEERLSSHTGTADSDVFNAKNDQVPPHFQRKRSKNKLFFGDESLALNALQTLVDLSLMLPDSSTESESSVQLKEERSAFDMDDKSSVPEATSTSHRKHKIKDSGPKEKTLKTITEVGQTNPRKSKIDRNTSNDFETIAEVKELHAPPNSKRKRKHENVPPKKASDVEALMDIHTRRTLEVEALAEKENKFSSKGKHTIQLLDQLRQRKPGRVLEDSPVNDQNRARIDLVASTIQVPIPSPASLPTKWKSRRKTVPKRKLSTKEVKTSKKSLENQPNENSTSHQTVEEELSCCLSSDMVRRWCIFEWFYSAIDYPWFFNKEFVEYLNHIGLGHVTRLTHAEWGVIRSSLGNPRRLSECFLHDKRENLKQYRESVRKHYFELRDGARDGLPRDLPRPLSVGQSLIAIHPKTRELHDGSVLTVDHDKCRVQFDRPELGVEFVLDIDCMPSNPLDNMPEALRRLIRADKFSTLSKEPQVTGHPYC